MLQKLLLKFLIIILYIFIIFLFDLFDYLKLHIYIYKVYKIKYFTFQKKNEIFTIYSYIILYRHILYIIFTCL